MKNDSKALAIPKFQLLLILSFIEGGCVMVAELAGAKMLAPFYGTSLYVWASTLAITLGGLTAGYYMGGNLSNDTLEKRKKNLSLILSVASALVIIMPVWASFVMTHTIDMSFLPGLVLSEMSFLFLPVFGMGMISPLIIGLIGETKNSGSAAGSVYAISTLGGILATLLTGFWLVPLIGISIPCVVVGALLLVAGLIILRPQKMILSVLLLAIFPTIFFVNNQQQQVSEKFDLLYYSEGILGQVKVLEFDSHKNGKTIRTRNLLVNHNWQTWIDADHPEFSFLYYTRFTNAIISSLPKNSSGLLIGLGGGTVAKQFEANNVAYDAVEIDGRLPKLAKQYFGLKGTGNLIVDDGRHFINKTQKKYDLVIIDALLGENVPSYLLSVECFEKIKSILNPNGKIFIEFDGVNKADKGIPQKLVYNSLVAAGFNCQTFTSIPNELDADMMFLAEANHQPNIAGITINKDPYYDYSGPLKNFEVTIPSNTTTVVTDNTPSLDYYLKGRMAYVRNDVLKKANESFLKEDVMFYY